MRIPSLPEKFADWIWPVLAVLLTVFLLASSVVDIEPGEVAVRVNNLTGSQTPVVTPGWTTRIPFVHSLHILDGAPQSFAMRGEKDEGDLVVAQLTVRASDGSNFHFADTTVNFQLKGEEAVRAIRDGGQGDGFKTWMRPYVRSILRDEFGRESTIAVSNPTAYAQASERARDRLNKVLGPHGITVTQLVTPRPQFNEAYEHAIEERNRLGNELQVITSNLDRSATERDRRLAEVDQAKNREIQERRAALETDLARAVAELAETKRTADTYRIGKIAEGQAAYSAATQTATQLQAELDAKYASRRAEIEAFRNQPVERVMERLGERLSNVTIEIQPYADDATPARVRYEDVRAP